MLGLCAYQTFARLEDWRSDEALWTSAVAVAPAAPRPALNLAVALERRSAHDAAARWARTAADLALVRGDGDVLKRAHGLLTWIALAQDSSCVSDSPC